MLMVSEHMSEQLWTPSVSEPAYFGAESRKGMTSGPGMRWVLEGVAMDPCPAWMGINQCLCL